MQDQNSIRVPQQDRSKRKVAQILEASLMLFFRNGYDLTTMREIARTIDLPIATVYQYFPNKSAILRSLSNDLRDRCVQCVQHALQELQIDGQDAGYRAAVSRSVLGVSMLFDEHPEWAEISRSIQVTPDTRAEANEWDLRIAGDCAARLCEARPDLCLMKARNFMLVSLQAARSTILFSLELPPEERCALREELIEQICGYFRPRKD